MAMLRPEQSRRCGDILADAVNSGKYLGGQVTESVACARGLEGMVTCRALKLLTDLRKARPGHGGRTVAIVGANGAIGHALRGAKLRIFGCRLS
jgi:hypothetical protein